MIKIPQSGERRQVRGVGHQGRSEVYIGQPDCVVGDVPQSDDLVEIPAVGVVRSVAAPVAGRVYAYVDVYRNGKSLPYRLRPPAQRR
jgi:hypothetical protein